MADPRPLAQQCDGHPTVALRKSPGGEILWMIPNGTPVNILGPQDGDSLEIAVERDGTELRGWIKADNLKKPAGGDTKPSKPDTPKECGPEVKALPMDFDEKTRKMITSEDFTAPLGSDKTILTYLVKTKAIVFVSGKWLIKHLHELQPLPRRQDLPREAFLDPEALIEGTKEVEESWSIEGNPGRVKGMTHWDDMYFSTRHASVIRVVLSYAWIRKGHPDPDGFHLKLLAHLVSLLLSIPNIKFDDVAIFWDFLSLDQIFGPGGVILGRTEDEERRFRASLSFMHVVYGHAQHIAWRFCDLPSGIHPSIADRGWPHFEKAMFSTAYKRDPICVDAIIAKAGSDSPRDCNEGDYTHSFLVLPSVVEFQGRDLLLTVSIWVVDSWSEFMETLFRDRDDRPENPVTIISSCKKTRLPPIVPSRFADELRVKIFTGKGDGEVVKQLYEDTFKRCLTLGSSFPWLDAFTECKEVEVDGLERDYIVPVYHWSIDELHMIAEVLPYFTQLRRLDIIGDEIHTGQFADPDAPPPWNAAHKAIIEAARSIPDIEVVRMRWSQVYGWGSEVLEETVYTKKDHDDNSSDA
mmetsp:Transcript_39712/g.74460  ORF Transcript_39712/g.74460 Transcript_39712/m.74460 type:complete len:580 (+) Transcript_39712:54-1793(+)